jgi:hypothetical protein
LVKVPSGDCRVSGDVIIITKSVTVVSANLISGVTLSPSKKQLSAIGPAGNQSLAATSIGIIINLKKSWRQWPPLCVCALGPACADRWAFHSAAVFKDFFYRKIMSIIRRGGCVYLCVWQGFSKADVSIGPSAFHRVYNAIY